MENIEHNSKFQSLRKIKIGIELLVILALCVIVLPLLHITMYLKKWLVFYIGMKILSWMKFL